MTDPLKRRDFIKTLSLAGASFAIANPVSANIPLPGNEINEIKNDYFTVSFDKKKGKINVYRKNGLPFLIGGTVCANLNNNKHFVLPDTYRYTLDSKSFNDQLGPGKRLTIMCRDKNKRIDLVIHLSLHDPSEAITIEAICKNVSAHDLVINSIEPLRVIKNEGGTLSVPGVPKCLTNGEMYYDAG